MWDITLKQFINKTALYNNINIFYAYKVNNKIIKDTNTTNNKIIKDTNTSNNSKNYLLPISLLKTKIYYSFYNTINPALLFTYLKHTLLKYNFKLVKINGSNFYIKKIKPYIRYIKTYFITTNNLSKKLKYIYPNAVCKSLNTHLLVIKSYKHLLQLHNIITVLDRPPTTYNINLFIYYISLNYAKTLGINVNINNLITLSAKALKFNNIALPISYNTNNNNIKLIAKPCLLITLHKTSTLFTGSKYPIKQQKSIKDKDNNVYIINNYKYISIGTRLKLNLISNKNNMLLLNLNYNNSILNNYTQQAVITSNYAINTTLLLKLKKTYYIAGLTRYKTIKSYTGIPIFKHIPFLKNIFGQTVKKKEKYVLLIVLRATKI